MTDAQRRRLFLGCFMAMIATAFGFAVRGAIISDWGVQFGLSEEQKGIIQGVGLYPFAISIILFSLIVDKVGYGFCMVFAFIGHVLSAYLTIRANSFESLYVATFIYALANGTVEAVINPVVATIYDKNKTHWLNVLHAGWPGGLVLGGLLAIAISYGKTGLENLSGHLWQWQMGLVFIPAIIYGVILFGQKFPVQERVAAGVSFKDMLKEFGWGSSYVVFFFLVAGISQILKVKNIEPLGIGFQALIAIVPTVLFALYVKSFGRPMFVFLLLVMLLLATTELGTDSWISDIMKAVLGNENLGIMFLVYTSSIMFVLRFFAGPIVHAISPLGLLATCAAIAAIGLTWLANAGAAVGVLFLAATLYGFGKTFFWPTTLGVVSEQYPRGGALMLNAISGVGMIAVGTLGNPAIGYLQDQAFTSIMQTQEPQLLAKVGETQTSIFGPLFGETKKLNQSAYRDLSIEQQQAVDQVQVAAKQGTLAKVAVLPAIMFVCYLGLIFYFRAKGGYQAQVLAGHAADDERFTGGTVGPVEA
ncbi:MAG: MFS transporter [Pirellulales bacterium]|nr:MFS transporter [Pirellulales bacterium]